MSSEKIKKDADKTEGKKEEKPTNLWNVALGANGFVTLFGGLEFFLCVMEQNAESQYMDVIEGYDKGNLLGVLGIVGLIAAMVGLYGAVLCFCCKKPGKVRRLRYMIYAYFGWGGGTVFLLFVSAALIFAGSSTVEVIFRPGFSGQIKKYRKEDSKRTPIDFLQQTLKCCGNFNYTDWFAVAFSDKVARTETAIPESCCRVKPCVHIVANGETQKLTPYTTGCVDAVVKHYSSMLNVRAMILVAIAIVESAALVVIYLEVKKMPAGTKAEQKKLISKSEPKKTSDGQTLKKESENDNDVEKPSPQSGGGYAPDYSMNYS